MFSFVVPFNFTFDINLVTLKIFSQLQVPFNNLIIQHSMLNWQYCVEEI